ncbi:uncharacterized protein BO97DRAFT_463312 [Aspergillus homomorphus CBS 101889]|uniref:Uncharacterized protein n=1 Tax=Aspergillus homomorphus (strain CBS 101889) TaxID=1450537 RepID=A0A395I683_ASPHC|nr:hypothetical protein BO97DRAFT_463312 [Aspergillus homomorphus CBS 101889]RAL15296.1 hypothetical protein BO97DRAFT_463312 [Aspergillus homomorphus CBS 101889]
MQLPTAFEDIVTEKRVFTDLFSVIDLSRYSIQGTMSSSRKPSNRPKKRVLSVCNVQTVKIPWADVASTMGHNVTEGAIVQHLAKLRSRRVAAGKPVPPPLRRGGLGVSNKLNEVPSWRNWDGPDVNHQRALANPKRGSEPGPSDFADVDSSSDEDYVEGSASKSRKKRAKTPGSRARRKRKPIVKLESEPPELESDAEEVDNLLVPGAEFLDCPTATTSSYEHRMESPGDDQTRKVVVLKYSRSINQASTGDVPEPGVNTISNDAFIASGYAYHRQPAGTVQFPIQVQAPVADLPGVFYMDPASSGTSFMDTQHFDSNHSLVAPWLTDTAIGDRGAGCHGLSSTDMEIDFSNHESKDYDQWDTTLLGYDHDLLG